jgi:hypothetical protein
MHFSPSPVPFFSLRPNNYHHFVPILSPGQSKKLRTAGDMAETENINLPKTVPEVQLR